MVNNLKRKGRERYIIKNLQCVWLDGVHGRDYSREVTNPS